MKGCNETSQIVIIAYPILLSYLVELNSEGYFLSGHPREVGNDGSDGSSNLRMGALAHEFV
jgi:hypothetical protein